MPRIVLLIFGRFKPSGPHNQMFAYIDAYARIATATICTTTVDSLFWSQNTTLNAAPCFLLSRKNDSVFGTLVLPPRHSCILLLLVKQRKDSAQVVRATSAYSLSQLGRVLPCQIRIDGIHVSISSSEPKGLHGMRICIFYLKHCKTVE